MVAMDTLPFTSSCVYNLERSGRNDRTRSRLTMRKRFDAAAYDFKVATPFFSNKEREFAYEWFLKENNCEYPTPRQVVEGVARFFEV